MNENYLIQKQILVSQICLFVCVSVTQVERRCFYKCNFGNNNTKHSCILCARNSVLHRHWLILPPCQPQGKAWVLTPLCRWESWAGATAVWRWDRGLNPGIQAPEPAFLTTTLHYLRSGMQEAEENPIFINKRAFTLTICTNKKLSYLGTFAICGKDSVYSPNTMYKII